MVYNKGIGAHAQGRTYFIADMSYNHNGSIGLAEKLFRIAIDAGCDAVKIPFINPESSYSFDFLDLNPALSSTLVNLPLDSLPSLIAKFKDKVDIILSPQDIESFHSIKNMSFSSLSIEPVLITHLPLLREIASLGKPIFLSIGGCSDQDIKNALEILQGCDVVLMHCVLCKHVKAEDAHLGFISYLRKYGRLVGFVDYENGIALAPIAVVLGAIAIEKRFTKDHFLPGIFHEQSLEPEGLRKIVRDIRKAERAHDSQNARNILNNELEIVFEHTRSLVSNRRIEQDEIINEDDISFKAPARGLLPEMAGKVIGKRAMECIERDEHITFSKVRF